MDFEPESEEVNLSQGSTNSEPSQDLPEESINEDFSPPISKPEEENLTQRLMDFIQSNANLHRQVLLYEPLWLEDLFQEFKSIANAGVKLNHVQDALDSQCITFRTRARHEKNSKRK